MVHALIVRKDIGPTQKKMFSGVPNLAHQISTHTSRRGGAYHATLTGISVDLTQTSLVKISKSHSVEVMHRILLAKNSALIAITDNMVGAISVLTIA